MSRRRRRSLIGRNPTSDRAPDRSNTPDTSDEAQEDAPSQEEAPASSDEGREEAHASSSDEEVQEPPDHDAPSTDVDAPEAESDEPHEAPGEEASPEPASSEPPTIAPPMMLEDAMPAPESSRDVASAEKQDGALDAALFSKDVDTANPAPQRTQASDAFPKEFEEEDEWFVKTGQPAPQRVDDKPAPAPIVTKQPNPWPLVVGLLAVAGLIGLLGVLLVLISG